MVELERFNGRRAAVLENAALRVTVLEGGGHIASILDKASGVSPLWIPPWPSIEPSAYEPGVHGSYGTSVEARLLASLMGHNLCLDVFGGPVGGGGRRGSIGARRSLDRDLRVRGLRDESDDASGFSDRTAPVRAAARAGRSGDSRARSRRERQRERSARLRGRSTSRSARPFLERGARSSERPRPDRSCSRDPSEPATTFSPAPNSTGRMRREPAVARSTCSAMWMPPPPAPTRRT